MPDVFFGVWPLLQCRAITVEHRSKERYSDASHTKTAGQCDKHANKGDHSYLKNGCDSSKYENAENQRMAGKEHNATQLPSAIHAVLSCTSCDDAIGNWTEIIAAVVKYQHRSCVETQKRRRAKCHKSDRARLNHTRRAAASTFSKNTAAAVWTQDLLSRLSNSH